MAHKFSTYLLDKVIAEAQQRREQQRLKKLTATLRALDQLSKQISFKEAYIFGSASKPNCFSLFSDIDIGFVGLKKEDFFPAMAFLSQRLGIEVDILQLEDHRLKERITREGIKWKRRD